MTEAVRLWTALAVLNEAARELALGAGDVTGADADAAEAGGRASDPAAAQVAEPAQAERVPAPPADLTAALHRLLPTWPGVGEHDGVREHAAEQTAPERAPAPDALRADPQTALGGADAVMPDPGWFASLHAALADPARARTAAHPEVARRRPDGQPRQHDEAGEEPGAQDEGRQPRKDDAEGDAGVAPAGRTRAPEAAAARSDRERESDDFARAVAALRRHRQDDALRELAQGRRLVLVVPAHGAAVGRQGLPRQAIAWVLHGDPDRAGPAAQRRAVPLRASIVRAARGDAHDAQPGWLQLHTARDLDPRGGFVLRVVAPAPGARKLAGTASGVGLDVDLGIGPGTAASPVPRSGAACTVHLPQAAQLAGLLARQCTCRVVIAPSPLEPAR